MRKPTTLLLKGNRRLALLVPFFFLALTLVHLSSKPRSANPPVPYNCDENAFEFEEPDDLEDWQRERYLSEEFQYGLESPKAKCKGELGVQVHNQLQDDIERLQKPDVCKSGRFLIWRLGTGGFGQEVRKLAYQLAIAYAENRTLILDTSKTWKYTDKDICPEQSFYCYFQPLTQCSMDDLGGPLESFPVWTEEANDQRIVVGNYNTDKWRYFTPTKYGTMLSLEWFRSELLAYVMRPNESTQALVREEKHRLGLDPDHVLPYISMHVRGGDKKTEYKLHPFQEYLNKATWFKSLYGVDNIFLVSDDANIIKQAGEDPNFHITWASGDRQPGGSHEITETGYSVMAKVLKDIFIASSCQYWIGTLSSNFGDVIWELMVARNHGTVPPYISLDIPWTTHNQPNVFI